ncbi:MAG TPA: galactokinase [Cyclobacteriaceae bacterium]|nr:galactokinase [Cyclobacteriaceae bacterium]
MLLSVFREKYQGEPIVVNAPGRINLLGEHLDYNLGQVMPAAIDKRIQFVISANGTDYFSITAFDLIQSRTFKINELDPEKGWLTYLKGVVQGIKNRGKEVGGVNCVFGGDIPGGAGLSSSAALCCGFAFSLNEIFDLNLTRKEIAEIAQFAEHEFAGVKCGIMDQYASLFSEPDHLLLLDCRSMEHQLIPFRQEIFSILLVDSKVKHSLVDTAYNDRRKSCEEGVKILNRRYGQVNSLRDVTLKQLGEIRAEMDEITFSRCEYVLQEMERVRRGAEFLVNDDLEAFGQLMYASHQGLSQRYEVSCVETDYLVDLAKDFGLIGSRMMGGGFGGCTINLVARDQQSAFSEFVYSQYKNRFGIEPEIYPVKTARGVHRVIE